MKILEVKTLALPEVKTIIFERFKDERGYFTETYRAEDFKVLPELNFIKDFDFVQHNESFSQKNIIRGLHFQWNPPMGKLVRTVSGHMVDVFMDIRQGSPNFGKVIMHNMPSRPEGETGEWIWVPGGFAHGNFFLEPTVIQYLCTDKHKPESEAGISPLSPDLDFSLCDIELKEIFEKVKLAAVISEKDKNTPVLGIWSKDSRAGNFVYGK